MSSTSVGAGGPSDTVVGAPIPEGLQWGNKYILTTWHIYTYMYMYRCSLTDVLHVHVNTCRRMQRIICMTSFDDERRIAE